MVTPKEGTPKNIHKHMEITRLEEQVKELKVSQEESAQLIKILSLKLEGLEFPHKPSSPTIADPRIDKMWVWVRHFNQMFTGGNNYMINKAEEQQLTNYLK